MERASNGFVAIFLQCCKTRFILNHTMYIVAPTSTPHRHSVNDNNNARRRMVWGDVSFFTVMRCAFDEKYLV